VANDDDDDDDDQLNCAKFNYGNLWWFGIIQLSKQFKRCKWFVLSSQRKVDIRFDPHDIIIGKGNVPTK